MLAKLYKTDVSKRDEWSVADYAAAGFAGGALFAILFLLVTYFTHLW